MRMPSQIEQMREAISILDVEMEITIEEGKLLLSMLRLPADFLQDLLRELDDAPPLPANQGPVNWQREGF